MSHAQAAWCRGYNGPRAAAAARARAPFLQLRAAARPPAAAHPSHAGAAGRLPSARPAAAAAWAPAAAEPASPLAAPLRLLFGRSWRKALPLSLLLMSATFVFTVLQSLRDALCVTAMGPEALPVLSTATLPASLCFFQLYRRVLVPSVPPQQLFYFTAAPFLAFYAAFSFVLLPLAPVLQNPPWLAWLPAALPPGLAGLAAALQYWLFALFYVAADLWGPVLITMAFWTVADEVCTLDEASQLYGRLGLLANVGLVGSGRLIASIMSGGAAGLAPGAVPVLRVQVLTCAMLAGGVLMFACKAYINRKWFAPTPVPPHAKHRQEPGGAAAAQQRQQVPQGQQQRQQQKAQQQAQEQQQQAASASSDGSGSGSGSSGSTLVSSLLPSPGSSRPSSPSSAFWRLSALRPSKPWPSRRKPGTSGPADGSGSARASWAEAWALLGRNEAARQLTVMVVCFGLTGRLFEVAFKSQLMMGAAGDSAAFCCCLAEVQSAIGAVTIVLMLASKFIFRRLGWRGAALATPLAMLLMGGGFYLVMLLEQAAALGGAAAAAVPRLPAWLPGLGLLPAAASPQALAHGLTGLGVALGIAASVLINAARFALQTPAREMFYKSLPAGEVKETKAVVDLVGGQVARSGAGWVVQALLLVFGSLAAALPSMAALSCVASVAWLRATLVLGRRMQRHQQQQATLSVQRERAELLQAQLAWQREEWEAQAQQLVIWEQHWAAQRRAWSQGQPAQAQPECWALPLPRDVAAAAAAAAALKEVAAASAQPQAAVAAGAAGAAGDAGRDWVGQPQQPQAQPQAQPPQPQAPLPQQQLLHAQHPLMLRDSLYWNLLFAAVAADPQLLDAVIGRGGAGSQQAREAASSTRSLSPPGWGRALTARLASSGAGAAAAQQGAATRGPALLAKEALHTTFD